MLLQPPVQAVPGAGIGEFPPLPEPLQPIGTRQGQGPGNRARNPGQEVETGGPASAGPKPAIKANSAGRK
eukprot:13021129-Heterocapsa_arctica.AAC.1